MTEGAVITFNVWSGEGTSGEFRVYKMPAVEGMVVRDVVHRIQQTQVPDPVGRRNCKAG